MDTSITPKKDNNNALLLLSCLVLGFLGGIIGANLVVKKGTSLVANPKNSIDLVDSAKSTGSVTEVVDRTSPSVVAISVIKNVQRMRTVPVSPFRNDFWGLSPFEFQFRQPTGTPIPQEVGGGSGFIVDSSGLIITNKHVVNDEDASYEVIFKSGEKIKAKVVARDPLLDLALLKVEKENLPVLEFADSAQIKVGQPVVAIGNALGEFPNSVSAGIISGLGRQVQASDQYTGTVETLNQVIQTDAAINLGNSGGPLLDLSGKVVGVNSAVAGSAENISFAIPSNEARRVMSDYKKEGRVVRAILGVRYIQIDSQIKEELKLSSDRGALIVSGGPQSPAVLEGSGADNAGLKEGDIILKIGGQDVTKDKPLQSFVNERKPGDTLVLVVISDGGRQKTVNVTLTEAK